MLSRLLRPVRSQEQIGGVIVGDASGIATFSYSLQGQLFSSQSKFDEDEQASSSGYIKLLNIHKTLLIKGDISIPKLWHHIQLVLMHLHRSGV